MAGLSVSNGTQYVSAKGVYVSNGTTYVQAKGVYVSNGDGTWRLAWPLLSGVALSAPSYAVSNTSGSNAPASLPNTIVSPLFTITLTVPAAVASVSLQLSLAGGAWTQYRLWTSAITSTLTYAIPFSTAGAWQARAVVTNTDGSQVISNIRSITCVAFTVTVTGSTAPIVGESTSVSAAMSPAAPVGFPATNVGWYLNRSATGWVLQSSVANPLGWTPTDTTWREYAWKVTFPDGSAVYSNALRQTPTLEEIHQVGGTATSMQNALNLAAANKVPTRFSGTFSGGTGVRIPHDAVVNCDPGTIFNGIQIFNGLPKTGVADGGYRRAGNITWTGGTFAMANTRSTAFSISHCPSFTLQGATIYGTTATGHGIEINSSGGAMPSGSVTAYPEASFKIRILNNTFSGMGQTPRDNGNDEAVHFDYAWTGATAAGTANDGTECHSILVKGNWFGKANGMSCSYPVGVGNHKTNPSGAAEHDMNYFHTHIRITNNTFSWCGPYSASGGQINRGTVDIRGIRQVQIINNSFTSSRTAVGINAQGGSSGGTDWGGAQGYVWIEDNTFSACGHYRPYGTNTNTSVNATWVNTNSDPSNAPQSRDVYIRRNLFTGFVGNAQDTYLITCNDVDTLWVNDNKFWGLTNNTQYTQQTSNRIHGSEASPSGTVSGYQCRNNTWAVAVGGSGAVEANS